MKPSTYRVGLAQLELGALTVEDNIERCSAAVRSAAEAGADVVVLPELANSGYVLDGPLIGTVAEDLSADGPALSAWSEAAAECGVNVVVGLAERSGKGKDLFNSAIVLDRRGDLVGHYRKLHLFAGEAAVFQPGDLGLPLVQVDDLVLGPLICYDLRFPEVTRIHALREADLLVVPTAWVGGFDRDTGQAEEIGQVRTTRVMANVNAIPIACASQVGTAGPFAFLGSSVVVDSFGNDVIGPLSRTDEAVVVTELDLVEMARARNRGPGMTPLEQRRADVYGSLLGYKDN